jgi:DNA-binding PadR family transcriptional regulator
MFSLGKTLKLGKSEINVSPIEYIILAHLRRREILNKGEIGQYGNELIGEFNKLFDGVWEAQSGTIYPILSKMDDYRTKNLIKGEEKKTPLGPVKKVYTLTDNGRDIINRIIIEKYEAEQNFLERYLDFLKTFKEFVEAEKSKHVGESDTKDISSIFNDVDKKKFPCPACKSTLVEGVTFCYSCGKKIEKSKEPREEEIILADDTDPNIFNCPKCNAEIRDKATFCAACGQKLTFQYK